MSGGWNDPPPDANGPSLPHARLLVSFLIGLVLVAGGAVAFAVAVVFGISSDGRDDGYRSVAVAATLVFAVLGVSGFVLAVFGGIGWLVARGSWVVALAASLAVAVCTLAFIARFLVAWPPRPFALPAGAVAIALSTRDSRARWTWEDDPCPRDPLPSVSVDVEGDSISYHAVPGGEPVTMIWPPGYSARRPYRGIVEILSQYGYVDGREGDVLEVRGTRRADGAYIVCDARPSARQP